MAIPVSDNYRLNAPKKLDDWCGVFDGSPPKWRPYNTVQEYIDRKPVEFRVASDMFFVKNPTDATRMDIWVLDVNLVPFLLNIPVMDGKSFLGGIEDPEDSLGEDGDHYVNTVTGLTFVKDDGEWETDGGNLKGAKGDKGNPGPQGEAFTYDDFTPEQIEELQQPAIDAAVIANNAATNANDKATLANNATSAANTATTNANTATTQANTARDSANAAAIVANNARGWSPLFVGEADGIDREVWKLNSWINGTGTTPTDNVGLYLKSDGTYTAIKADAANYKGEKGNNGIATPNINAGNLVGRTTVGFGSAEEITPVGITLSAGVATVNYQNAVSAYNPSLGVNTILTNGMSGVEMFQNLQKQVDSRIVNTGSSSNLVLGDGTYQSLATLPAFTATKLLTPRNINGVSFDGTANITVTSPSNLALGTRTDTTQPITNDNGTGFTLPVATTSLAGLLSGTLKTAYDAVVTWISTNGTNVLNHLASTSNPHSVTKTQVGLSNVDNTADTAKPVSTAQQTALNLKANLASPTFTGTPALPTGTIAVKQTVGNNTTAVATTSFVAEGLATKAPIREDIVSVTGNKTFALSDENKFQDVTANSSLTVPLNSVVAFPIGTEIEGAVRDTITGTFVATSGVTIINKSLIVAGLTAFTLKKVATDTWLLTTNASSGGGANLKTSTTLSSLDIYTNRYKDITVTGAVVGDLAEVVEKHFLDFTSNNIIFLSAKVTSTNTVRVYITRLVGADFTEGRTLTVVSVLTNIISDQPINLVVFK